MPRPDQHIGGDPAPKAKSGCVGCAVFLGGTFAVMTLVASLLVAGWQSKTREAAFAKLSAIRAAGEPTSGIEVNEYYEKLVADAPDITSVWLDVTDGVKSADFMNDTQAFPFQPFGDKSLPLVNQPWPEEHQARSLLLRQAKLLKAIHTAADRDGKCRYPADFRQLFATQLDYLNELRQVARLVSLEAHLHARQQDDVAYVNSMVGLLSAGDSVRHEPCLVSMLVRLAIHGIAFENIRTVLTRLEISPEESRRLQKHLLSLKYEPQMRFAYVGERGVSAEIFLNPQSLGHPVVNRLPTKYADLNNYLRWMGRVVAATRLEFPEAAQTMQAIGDEFQAFANNMSLLEKSQNVLVMLTFPAVTSAHQAVGRNIFLARASATALAVEQYRQRQAKLPVSLGELVPEFIDAVPRDPYTNQPLQFKLSGEGYVIYSVGPDFSDNGGIMEPHRFEPDLVFAIPSEPPEESLEEE